MSIGPLKMFNVADILLAAATGGSSLVASAARQLISAFGQQLIQQVGQRLGLPQSAIDVAQAQFAASTGDVRGVRQNLQEALSQVSQDLNLSPAQQGELSREIRNGSNDLLEHVLQNAIDGNNSVGDAVNTRANGKGRAGGSWLERLAAVMSEAIEDKMGDLEKLAKTAKNGASETNQFQVASQEFSLLMNTTTTAIKSIGEALGNMARKQ